jgi:hypothetical protein
MLFSHKLSSIGKVSSTDQLSRAEARLTDLELQELLANILSTLPIALQGDQVKTRLTPDFQAHSAQMAALDNGHREMNRMTTPKTLHCKA